MSWCFRGDDPDAVAGLRREIVGRLRRDARRDADLDGAAVVIGELLGNVVRHAPGPASVRLEWAGERPLLEVRDTGPGYPYEPSLPDPATHVGGRGLFLVSKLAHSVTVSTVPGGGSLTSVELALTR
jgi:anti-sigma regulatory factor (Ser/Thr protein kinase)